MDLFKFNEELDIAIGQNRQDTSWRNKAVTWGDFLERIKNPKRTPETVREWNSMTKLAKGERKDVGGFVGGFLSEGRRKKGHVAFRSLVTLDIDYGEAETWTAIKRTLPEAAMAIYTTHSHSESSPRYRLILPLLRTVRTDEYECVARWIAGKIGIDIFDDCTFEPERLMYWPSCSIDAPYIFDYQDGEAINPDMILDSFTDWHDTSSWPISSRVTEVVKRSIQKQGNPLEKPGIVGAFCRTYTISQAIAEFLPDVYEASERHPDRYTYIAGSAKEGFVIYDGDLYGYSNHGTDPIFGKEVNAFDLVRIHKFGLRDENCKEDTPINRRPSYLAMEEFARKDKATTRTINAEKLAAARDAFDDEGVDGDIFSEPQEEDLSWMDALEHDKKSNYLSTLPNISLVIENARELKDAFVYDEFRQRVLVTRRLPWSREGENFPRSWGNADDDCLQVWISKDPWKMTGKDKILTAFSDVLNRKHVHPVREYLKGLPDWDGTERLDSILIDYLGAADTPLVRAMTRKALTAAVARIMRPGCKFDYMLTLIGPEGIGKSRLLSILAVKEDFFSDSLITIEGKEAMEQLSGKWIIEVGELSNYKRSTVDSYKAFVSKQTDSFRPAFARKTEDFPRQCVFIATTNEDTPLKGDTGNRRFWVCDVGVNKATREISDIRGDLLDQIWAEARHRFNEGELLYLSEDLEREARLLQSEKNEMAGDDRLGLIEDYIRTLIPNDWDGRTIESRRAFFEVKDNIDRCGDHRRDFVSAVEVLAECLGEPIGRQDTRYKTREINALLRRIKGLKDAGRMYVSGYGRQRVFSTSGLWDNDRDNRRDNDGTMF